MEAKFWGQVKKTDTCWHWVGAVMGKGYGQFWYNDKNWRVHRLAYIFIKGSIPGDMMLDHLCRNKVCVNPDHLEPVTNRENVLRGIGISAINARKTHCKRGHIYDDTNTRITPKGARVCRECSRISHRLKRELSNKEVSK